MSCMIASIILDADLPAPEKPVLFALADGTDDRGTSVFPSYDLVARKTGYSEDTVRDIIDGLIARGILERIATRSPDTFILRINYKRLPEAIP